MALEFEDMEYEQFAKIRVVGVGGGGNNSIDHMVANKVNGVDFVAVNTDVQALKKSTANDKLQIGTKLTKGLGSGGNPEMGRKSAEESREDLKEREKGIASFRCEVYGDTSHLKIKGIENSFSGRFCEVYSDPTRH